MKLTNICTNCQTVENDGIVTIFSYNTPVLRVRNNSRNISSLERLWSDYSVTTMRHINKALTILGETPINKAVWDSMPVMEA